MATTNAIDVVMPQMGVSVSEGTITKWLKQEGEQIAADEPLLEISTDKVDTEVPSPGEGVVQQILVQEGETVDVGTKLAVIAPPGAEAAAPEPEAAPEAEAAPEPEAAPAPEAPAPPAEPAPVAEEPPQAQPPPQPPAAPPAPPEPAAAPAPPPPQPPAPAPQPEPVAAAAGEEIQPMNAMRRGIAEHMRRSLDTSAHVTTVFEIDLSKVVAIRKRLKPEYEQSYGVNPTYLAFIARATIEAIKNWPWVNAEVRGEQMVIKHFVNLGIAVALEGGHGLIVPVIKNAEGLNLLGLARGIADIAERARNKKLTPDDVQGGTFTITNPGGWGAIIGTPIISQPQVAILDVEALVKRPVVVSDESGQDVIAIRPMMNLCLSYDHRLVDGAYAAQFMKELRENLEGWG